MIKLLLIDDSPDNLTVLKAVLSDRLEETKILTALSGRKGLELAQAEDPDVILLDIVMPGMDGYEVCRTLKQDARLQAIPVLFLTALMTDKNSRVKALEVGAEGFITKPVDEVELTAQIRAMAKIKAANQFRRMEKEELAALVADRTRELEQEIARRKQAEAYRDMGCEVLQILNQPGELKESVRHVLAALKARTGFDAVGIRLQDGEDFPYFAREGFPDSFLLTENTLAARDADGGMCRDGAGKVSLECTCGLVLSGTADPSRPLFTQGGSFWTNNSFPLLDLPADQDPRLNPRNQCMRYGYASMALVPIRTREGIVGLIHFCDSRKDGFTLTTVTLLEGIASHIGEALMRKRTEEELQKMQKLQSVGTLAGGIAHDFNNILLGLFGNISLAKDELAKGHPGYTLLEEAEKSMNRAVRLTKQLLTFAKGGAPVKEDLSLGALVEEIARFDLSGSHVKLVYRQAEDLWRADADKGQIQQVISNLVINARQAMPQSGSLHITLANADLTLAAIPGLRPGRYVRITVQDEGAGIDPKVLHRIFDPYFTTKQAGSGLGLATVYSVITKHGGHVGVASELGKGTTFTLHLPAAASSQPAVARAPGAERPGQHRSASVLVMDDEEMVCSLVAKMLTRCGHTVATAPGGLEALAMYKRAQVAGAPFDVVIMDLTIPGGVGGKEAIKDFLALDPHVRAIVSSGYAEDPVMANFAEYGFKGIAAKPYTPSELCEVVGRVLK